MKKLSLNEEFSINGRVYMFIPNGTESMSIKYIRDSKAKYEFTPPTLEDVKAYFKAEGYPEDLAVQFHKSYSSNNWCDSNNRPVKAWKMKAINVWFKNYKPEQSQQPNTGLKFFI